MNEPNQPIQRRRISTLLDSTEPPTPLVTAATRDLPQVFNNVPKAHYRQHESGEKTANYWQVIDALIAKGHGRDAAEWAIHRLAETGLLSAEQGMQSLTTMLVHGIPTGPSTVLSDDLRHACLRATPALWARWHEESATAHKGVPAANTSGRATKESQGRGKNIDAQMLKVMAEKVESHGWSAIQWANHLDCSDGTVKGTKTWKVRLKAVRALAAADSALKRQQPNTTSRGRQKRKPNPN